jgi:uncharacterized protein (TIGR00725 family)
MKIVAVIGSGTCAKELAAQAEEVGRLLAEAGVSVLCGGLGGVMLAACKGAKLAGGLTIGILPGSDPKEANSYVDVALPTGLGEARNVLVARAGHAVIAVGGELGTLTEIAFALKAGRTVVGLGTWRLGHPATDQTLITEARDAKEAVRLALEAIGS